MNSETLPLQIHKTSNSLFSKLKELFPSSMREGLRKTWIKRPGFLALSKSPVTDNYGAERGLPIDRFYIEEFLKKNQSHIKGRVLEIGDRQYTEKFGIGVTQSDVFHAAEGNPQATIVGDISKPESLEENAYDCIILTQVLQCIYDVHGAIANLHKALKPGGALLLTDSCVAQIFGPEYRDWGVYWRFTDICLKRLLSEAFLEKNVQVEPKGNYKVTRSYLKGLATHDLKPKDFLESQPDYQLVVLTKSIK